MRTDPLGKREPRETRASGGAQTRQAFVARSETREEIAAGEKDIPPGTVDSTAGRAGGRLAYRAARGPLVSSPKPNLAGLKRDFDADQ